MCSSSTHSLMVHGVHLNGNQYSCGIMARTMPQWRLLYGWSMDEIISIDHIFHPFIDLTSLLMSRFATICHMQLVQCK